MEVILLCNVIYKDCCCLLTPTLDVVEPNDYCCSDCIMHIAVEHDKLLEEGKIDH